MNKGSQSQLTKTVLVNTSKGNALVTCNQFATQDVTRQLAINYIAKVMRTDINKIIASDVITSSDKRFKAHNTRINAIRDKVGYLPCWIVK